MIQKPVLFPCGELWLSGYCYYPEVDGTLPGVVVCHPHPLYGGSMGNSVIRELGTAVSNHNIIALMFNFRGVGKSTGKFSDGIGEQDDVIATLDWLAVQPQIDIRRLGLCGYSFGGRVAASVACKDERVKSMALISPAFSGTCSEDLQRCIKSKFFITGEDDDVILPELVKFVYDTANQPKQFKLIPRVDHFWGGFEKTLASEVANFFNSTLRDIVR